MRSSAKKRIDKENVKIFAFAKSGDLSALKTLLKKKQFDLNIRDEEDWTPLCWAVFNGHLEVAKELIRCGAWVNVKDNQGRFPLYFACGWGGEYGDNGIFTKILLDSGADIDATTNDDWSALYLCSFKGRVASARELVKRGADIFQADTQGRIAYDIAAMRKNQPIQELIRAKAEEFLRDSTKKGNTVIMKKILNGSIPVNINGQEANGFTALHIAMENGMESSMKLLIEHKADPYATTKNGKTPQDLAAGQGNLVLLKLYRKFLMDKGVKIELPKSSDILRANPRRTKQTKSVMRSDSSVMLPGIKAKRRNKEPRTTLRRTSSTILINDEDTWGDADLLDMLNSEEKQIAMQDPRLRGLLKQLEEPEGGEHDSADAISFSNLAYGTLLCHLEELLRKLDNCAFETEDLDLILRSLGVRSKAQIRESANLFKPTSKYSEMLVDHYFAQACDDDEVDDIIIDPALAENYIKLMENEKKLNSAKTHSDDIMKKLLLSAPTNLSIEVRRSGSSSELLNTFQAKQFTVDSSQ